MKRWRETPASDCLKKPSQSGVCYTETTETKEVSSIMAVYICDVCGWEYSEKEGLVDEGIAPGTKWEDVPADFVCPLCGAPKEDFSLVPASAE